jgi:hypothetical protein
MLEDKAVMINTMYCGLHKKVFDAPLSISHPIAQWSIYPYLCDVLCDRLQLAQLGVTPSDPIEDRLYFGRGFHCDKDIGRTLE